MFADVGQMIFGVIRENDDAAIVCSTGRYKLAEEADDQRKRSLVTKEGVWW